MIAFATWRFGDLEKIKKSPSLLTSKTPSSESKYEKPKGSYRQDKPTALVSHGNVKEDKWRNLSSFQPFNL